MQAGQKKNLLLWIIIAVAVVIVAAGAGFGLRYLQSKDDTKTILPHDSLPQADPLQKDVGRAQELALDGNFDQAQEQLSKALQDNSLSNDNRFAIMMQQGITYYNQGKYTEAIAAYQAAAKLKETQSLYESLADAAEATGNKELAIASYKKAIPLIPADRPLADDDKDSYEKKIKALGGQP